MSILTTLKGWFSMLRKSRTKEEFNIEPITSEQMEAWVNECINIYQGNPSWLDPEDGIDTVNFAKAICSEVAKLTMLGAKINTGSSARAEWLKKQVDRAYPQLRHWVEYGCVSGTVLLKPNSDTIDLYQFGQYEVTHITNGEIDGAVFYNVQRVGDDWYKRLEYHRFEGDTYCVTNKCFIGASENDDGKPIDISLTPWADLMEEAYIQNVDKPLFGVFRTPQANNIAPNSPYGLPIFSEAVQELRDLDIAYSRNANEIQDSKRTVLLDSDLMMESGQKLTRNAHALEMKRKSLGLPDMVKNVTGNGSETFYQEINPTLNTDVRLTGINDLRNQIGYKVGFANGHFDLSKSSGLHTATEVEADQQRTIQFIKDVRDKLENCLGGVVYALNVFADLYKLAPAGAYELICDFGDITYNLDEDRARWLSYVQMNMASKEAYLMKFEGMTKEEARAMVEEATPKTPTLFGGEE